MVLQFLAQEYFARSLSNESIPFEEDFNQTSWNENNLDFYVPPHPLLYLVNFRFVEFAMITALNLIFPGTTSHLIHIGILGISQIYSFLSGLFLALVASPIFFKLIFVGHFGLHNYWNYQGWRELVVSLNFKRVKIDFCQTFFFFAKNGLFFVAIDSHHDDRQQPLLLVPELFSIWQLWSLAFDTTRPVQ